MKKLLGIVLAVALMLSLVTIVPSFAVTGEALNLDWISCYNDNQELIAALSGANAWVDFGDLNPGSILGNLKEIAEGATVLQFVGWYLSTKEIADVGLSVDGGEIEYNGYAYYEQGLVDALVNMGWENAQYALRVVVEPQILEGNHTLTLYAKFADGSSKKIYEMFYSNKKGVAVGKPAYASLQTVPAGGGALISDNVFWNPSFITDGTATLFANVETPLGWYASTTTEDVDAKLCIDLEGVYSIDSVLVEAMGFNNIAWPQEYKVLTSLDGKEWKELGGESGVTINNFSRVKEYAGKGNARYVLLQCTKFNLLNDGNGIYYAGLGEIEVFGTKISDGQPGRNPFGPVSSYKAGTVRNDDVQNDAAWFGFSTMDTDFDISFRTDVSFNKIGFPAFWSYPGTPLTFNFYKDNTLVYSFDYTTAGDAPVVIDIGTTLEKGAYDLQIVINDDSINPEHGYMKCYVVLGYASEGNLYDENYFYFERGKVAMDLYTDEVSGIGFVPFDYVEPAQPGNTQNPGNGDATMVIFVLAAAALALVVLKKKAFNK